MENRNIEIFRFNFHIKNIEEEISIIKESSENYFCIYNCFVPKKQYIRMLRQSIEHYKSRIKYLEDKTIKSK